MNKWFVIFFVSLILYSCNNPKKFSDEALTEKLVSLNGDQLTFNDVLEKHKDKKIVLDIWASWCKDCIVRLPQLKQLQVEYPNVSFVFLSQDFTDKSWKNGIKRFAIHGDHYYMKQKKKGPLSDFINLWWIPRYLVINEKKEILLFKATKITDKKIRKALKN